MTVTDLHIHITGIPDAEVIAKEKNRIRVGILGRLMAKVYGFDISDLETRDGVSCIREKILLWIKKSRLDRAVLLALDGARNDCGKPISGIPDYLAGNEYVVEATRNEDRLLFGASVHPYRQDAIRELERLDGLGASLVKWIPSAQNINPLDKRCLEFYEAMACLKIPLLCHTGNEHTIRIGNNELNRPSRLIPALKRGVTVIAAHCGTRMMLHERSYFREWKRMVLDHEKFYGDLGAFLVPTRIGALKEIIRTPQLTDKVVYGSDFPMVPWMPGLSFIIGRKKARLLSRIQNPFDRPWMMLEYLGVEKQVFSRADELLKIPSSKLGWNSNRQGADN